MAKRSRRLIGLMSGMSMDGVDLACVDVEGEFPDLKVELVATHFRPYRPEFQRRLQSATQGDCAEISKLGFLVAAEFSQCVNDFLKENGIMAEVIDAIGSHGQTLFHATDPEEEVGSTLQVGSPSIIAQQTGLLTIGNFRVSDVANGGRGAPLVSLADFILFRSPHQTTVLNNLGSISNVTVVTADIENMLAFDTGPANMAIDFYARRLGGIDKDGAVSAKGKCLPDLLQKLLQDPFFAKPPPKSAGYGEFGPDRLFEISKPFASCRTEDLLRTGVEFAALTLAQAYNEFIYPRFGKPARVVFSGGGVYNQTLMRRIREVLPDLQIEILESELADAKEAMAFALLANETLSGRPGSLPCLTGVAAPTLLGEIAL
jgi:anhydro-N-acetylmuramic acid kinase